MYGYRNGEYFNEQLVKVGNEGMFTFMFIGSIMIMCMQTCMYVHVPSTRLHIILIVTIESDTGKYHEFIAVYCYECEARVTMPEAMNE